MFTHVQPSRLLRRLTVIVSLLSCAPGWSCAQGPPAAPDSVARATITGVVLDSLGKPVANATVRVASGSPSTVTDTAGAFRLAGVPAGNTRVQVTGDGYTPLGFEFAIAPNVVVSLKLTLLPGPKAPVVAAALPAAASPGAGTPPGQGTSSAISAGPPDTIQAKAGQSILSGVVVDSGGRTVFGATVQAMSTAISTVSDSSGRFRLQALPPGLTFIRVRKIGYLSEYFPLALEAGRVATLTVKLRPASSAPSLARVEVRADARQEARMAGFYERMRKANGIFVEREELLRRNASQITEVLRGRNGVNIIRDSQGQPIVFGRNLTGAGYCAMGVILDGVFVNTNGLPIDQLVNTQDVRAIEVYKSGPAVPSEFQRRETDCGAVIIWTR
jgi:Carboxypeptidase regulatory-like domain/TonB-dependent Receptor Plug Domain